MASLTGARFFDRKVREPYATRNRVTGRTAEAVGGPAATAGFDEKERTAEKELDRLGVRRPDRPVRHRLHLLWHLL